MGYCKESYPAMEGTHNRDPNAPQDLLNKLVSSVTHRTHGGQPSHAVPLLSLLRGNLSATEDCSLSVQCAHSMCVIFVLLSERGVTARGMP